MNEKKIPFWLQPEFRRLEFKEAWPKGDQIARTAITFANGDGGLIEAWSTGIQKMRIEVANYPDIRLVLQEAGHAFQVQFVKMRAQEAQEAAEESQKVLSKVERDIIEACQINDKSGSELLAKTGYTIRTGNFKKTLTRLLDQGLVEMTIPDKPRSSKQRYRLTKLGRGVLLRLTTKDKR